MFACVCLEHICSTFFPSKLNSLEHADGWCFLCQCKRALHLCYDIHTHTHTHEPEATTTSLILFSILIPSFDCNLMDGIFQLVLLFLSTFNVHSAVSNKTTTTTTTTCIDEHTDRFRTTHDIWLANM